MILNLRGVFTMKGFIKTAVSLAAIAAMGVSSFAVRSESVYITDEGGLVYAADDTAAVYYTYDENDGNAIVDADDPDAGLYPYSYPVGTHGAVYLEGNPINQKFVMNALQPYCKVWVKNDGASPVTLSVSTSDPQNGNRVADTGSGTTSFTIQPGGQGRFWFQASDFDENGERLYCVNIGSPDGNNSLVSLRVRAADRQSELGY